MKKLSIPLTVAFAIFVIIIGCYACLYKSSNAIHKTLKANSFCVSIPNTDHAWDLSDRYAITSEKEAPIEILVTTPEVARDEANLVNFMSAKIVAQELARHDGYVAFKIEGIDDRLFVTSPLNIVD